MNDCPKNLLFLGLFWSLLLKGSINLVSADSLSPIQLIWRNGICLNCSSSMSNGQFYYNDIKNDTLWTVTALQVEQINSQSNEYELPQTFLVSWKLVWIRGVAKWAAEVPSLRQVAGQAKTERLIRFIWTRKEPQLPSVESPQVGKSHLNTSEFDTTTPLSIGNWHKLSFGKEGIYKINVQWLSSFGVQAAQVNPHEVVVFGGDRGHLPESNRVFRLTNLAQYPLQFWGDNDSVWEAEEYFLFYVPGAERIEPNSVTNRIGVVKNPYSDSIYCFLNFDWQGSVSRISQGQSVPGGTINQKSDRADFSITHEKELYNPIKSGRQWLGESMEFTSTINLTMNLPEYSPGDSCTLDVLVAARSIGVPSTIAHRVNSLPYRNISVPPVTSYYLDEYYLSSRDIYSVDPGGSEIIVKINYNKPNANSIAWIDRVEVHGRPRLNPLNLWKGPLFYNNFSHLGGQGTMAYYWPSVNNLSFQVWEVTQPWAVRTLNIESNDSSIVGPGKQFVCLNTDSLRRWVMFEGNNYENPKALGLISNQNLHSDSAPEMIILVPMRYKSQAQKIADLHLATDGLICKVVDIREIYNEFSSGRQDPVAIRDYLRMLYFRDFGRNSSHRLKYLLLFGPTSYDFKGITGSVNQENIPIWQSLNSNHPIRSYASDIFYSLMDSTEGNFLEGGLDRMDIAVGRIPINSEMEAEGYVQKMLNYHDSKNQGSWKNDLIFVADDEDYNLHLNDCSQLINYAEQKFPSGLSRKLFLDSYTQEIRPGGARYPEVNDRINRHINNGCLLFTYIGHGGVNGLAEERVMTNPEIDSWNSQGRFPLFVTGTCEFARFDNHQIRSAGLRALFNPIGGPIALFTTTRVTFTDGNLMLSSRLFRDNLFHKESGKYMRLGDIFLSTLNPDLSSINTRNYSLLGDPAMYLAYPEYSVRCSADSDTLRALSIASLSGEILNSYGVVDSTFDGEVEYIVFDKPSALNTKGNDPTSFVQSYSEYRNSIIKGRATVTNGSFRAQFRLPKDINYFYGFGRISLYAKSKANLSNHRLDASGVNDSIVIGGSSVVSTQDREGPDIHLSLNDSLFSHNGTASSNPILIADLFDSSGINTTGLGIGRDLQIVLTSESIRSEIVNSYFVSEIDDYRSGRITFPLGYLKDGTYTLTLKAWDNFNNSSTKSLLFKVRTDGLIQIHAIRAFPNPAGIATGLDFEINHNRPNTTLMVDLSIQNMNGQKVATRSSQFNSAGYFSRAIHWDCMDNYGNSVSPGLYLVKLLVRNNEEYTETFTKILLK